MKTANSEPVNLVETAPCNGVSMVGVGASVGAGASQVVPLLEVDLSVAAGRSAAILGPSGSGKTTLLRVLIGEVVADRGVARVANLSPATAFERGVSSFLPQDYDLLPYLSATQNVALSAELRGSSPGDAAAAARATLSLLDLTSEEMERLPGQLSGGQQQRIAAARAIVHRPAVVLADEPSAALDPQTGRKTFQQFLDVCTEAGSSVVVATHDRFVAEIVDHRYELRMGRLEPLD